MNIVVLASGGLGFDVLSDLYHDINIVSIATDSESKSIIRLARESSTPLFEGNPREGRLYDFLEQLEFSVDIILSINYLFIVEKDIINYPLYCLNIHGSLLPKYRGRTPHVWAIINNEAFSGITLHVITENCDAGPIVHQDKITIYPEMTGGDLLEKFRHLYPDLIRRSLKKIDKGDILLKPQDETKATYFGKRTPADGEINWDWHRGRIKNWVRALSDPYPGAFTFVGNQKIIIDKVSFSDRGFDNEVPNGSILTVEPYPTVKTPNGALILTDIRNELKDLSLKKMVLGI